MKTLILNLEARLLKKAARPFAFLLPIAPIEVSPACHARHENILKEQVVGAVQIMIEEINGS